MSTSLYLVQVGTELFPYSQSDFELLLSKGVTLFRIPVASLPLLSKTSLKGVKVERVTWKPLLQKLHDAFLSALTTDQFKFKSEAVGKVVVKYSPKRLNEIEDRIKTMSSYVVRYGFKLAKVYRHQDDGSAMVRLTVIPDESADPSQGFDLIKVAQRVPYYLNFSPVARMSFCIETSPSSQIAAQVFVISFEDLISGSWNEAFKRSFDLKRISKQEILNFISGMTNMIGSLK